MNMIKMSLCREVAADQEDLGEEDLGEEDLGEEHLGVHHFQSAWPLASHGQAVLEAGQVPLRKGVHHFQSACVLVSHGRAVLDADVL